MNPEVLRQMQAAADALVTLASTLVQNEIGAAVVSLAEEVALQVSLLPTSPVPMLAAEAVRGRLNTMRGYVSTNLNPDPITGQILGQIDLLREQCLTLFQP